MLQHTKRQVKLFEMHCFKMFITALCIIFLIKLRWPNSKSLNMTHPCLCMILRKRETMYFGFLSIKEGAGGGNTLETSLVYRKKIFQLQGDCSFNYFIKSLSGN